MSDTLAKSGTQTEADCEATHRLLLAEMGSIEEDMDRVRIESDRLKIETQILTATTEAKLARLEELVSNWSKAQ